MNEQATRGMTVAALAQYEQQAVLAAKRLGCNPHATVQDAHGYSMPQWLEYARKMHELRVLLDGLKTLGIAA